MTPIATMVKELLEKGVAHDAIVIAIEGAERALSGVVSGGIPVDVSAEKRRAYDRDRKRRDAEIRRNSGGNPRNSENASLSEEDKKEDIQEERGSAKRNSRGQRLPDEWAPDADDWQVSLTSIGADRSRAELAKFRDHWKQQPGSKGVKLDWAATWRNWIRRAAEYHGGANGHRNNSKARGSGSADFFAGMRSVAEDIAGDGAAPRDVDPEIPRGRIEIEG